MKTPKDLNWRFAKFARMVQNLPAGEHIISFIKREDTGEVRWDVLEDQLDKNSLDNNSSNAYTVEENTSSQEPS